MLYPVELWAQKKLLPIAFDIGAADVFCHMLRRLAELPRDLAATRMSGNKFNRRTVFRLGE